MHTFCCRSNGSSFQFAYADELNDLLNARVFLVAIAASSSSSFLSMSISWLSIDTERSRPSMTLLVTFILTSAPRLQTTIPAIDYLSN